MPEGSVSFTEVFLNSAEFRLDPEAADFAFTVSLTKPAAFIDIRLSPYYNEITQNKERSIVYESYSET